MFPYLIKLLFGGSSEYYKSFVSEKSENKKFWTILVMGWFNIMGANIIAIS